MTLTYAPEKTLHNSPEATEGVPDTPLTKNQTARPNTPTTPLLTFTKHPTPHPFSPLDLKRSFAEDGEDKDAHQSAEGEASIPNAQGELKPRSIIKTRTQTTHSESTSPMKKQVTAAPLDTNANKERYLSDEVAAQKAIRKEFAAANTLVYLYRSNATLGSPKTILQILIRTNAAQSVDMDSDNLTDPNPDITNLSSDEEEAFQPAPKKRKR